MGDWLTVEEFAEDIESHCLIDYDGFGYWIKNGEPDRSQKIYPSDFTFDEYKAPEGVAHIMWYNR